MCQLSQKFKNISDVDTELFQFKPEKRFQLYPSLKRGKECTMLLVTNLAYPQWVSVSCDQRILRHVVCVKEINEGNVSAKREIPLKMTCPNATLLRNKTCYRLVWFNNTIHEIVSNNIVSHVCKICSGYKMTIKNNAIFKFLFTAIESEQLVLLSLSKVKSSLINLLRYKKLWLTHKFEMKNVSITKASGYFACSMGMKNTVFNFGNCFQNKENVYMSSLYLSDLDNIITHSNTSLEGLEWQCIKSHQSYPKQEQDTASCSCFPLFYQSISGYCSTYNMQIFQPEITHSNTLSLNNSDETSICRDIGRHCAVDELPLKHTLKNAKVTPCNTQHLFKCGNNDMGCFNILDVCLYRLDILWNLFPCWSGSHIMQCKYFECSQYYKCPGYYCIPWNYVCDGKWDCPYGHDELGIHGCGPTRTCKQMFKCWNSQVCIHMFDICNNFKDCPKKDDEAMCELRDVNCPRMCKCLNFAVMCTVIPKNEKFFFNSPLVSFHFVSTNINSLKFLDKAKFLAVLNVSHNSITSICDSVHKLNKLKIIDVSSNYISQISSRCFSGFEKLHLIRFSRNKLIHILEELFYNLDEIASLDVSQNELNVISKNSFHNVTRILRLILFGNPLATIDSNIFAGLYVSNVITDSFQICCITSRETFCSADKPLHISCSTLLPDLSVKVATVSISLSILTLNVLSILINIITFKNIKEGELYATIVSSINIVDILYGIYLFITWAMDFHYGKDFILHYFQWKINFLCQISFVLLLSFSLLNPYLLCILSLARLMVIKYPLNSKFRSPSFVLKCILCGNATLFVLCLSILISLKTMPTSFCSPFIDPSSSRSQIKFTSVFVALIQFVAFMFTCVVYYSIMKSLSNKDYIMQIRHKTTCKNIALQFVLLTSSNLCSWFPSSIIFVMSLFLIKYPFKLLVWTTVAVMPTNSVVNPLIFLIFNTKIKILCKRNTNERNTLNSSIIRC